MQRFWNQKFLQVYPDAQVISYSHKRLDIHELFKPYSSPMPMKLLHANFPYIFKITLKLQMYISLNKMNAMIKRS